MRGVAALVITVAVGAGGYALSEPAHAETTNGLGPGLVTVTVGIHYSKFSMSTLHVARGTTVRFLIRNQDPINHEFIVGDAKVHLLHELGKEKAHPPVPGEASVSPLGLGETFYRFDKPGRYLFACHLPGHFAYGMHGWVVVAA
jgi:uncharacterized cupredoxin-like copper-binding protein